MAASGVATAGSSVDMVNHFEGTAYDPEKLIGAGGMGEVWLVRHRELGREFVAKVIHQRLMSDAQLLDRVRLEAQSLGRLNHPHIVSVAGLGNTRDGRPFIVMEHLRGATLAQELKARRLPLHEAVQITRELLSALSAAHELGIIHRDIKPENLFLHTANGGRRVLKVLDFGVARVLPGVSEQAPMPLFLPTGEGIVVGTPRFVSPEVASGQGLDQRADLYSAGLVLYAMLAGRGPFDHVRSQDMLLTAHAVEDPEPPSAHSPEPIPAELDHLVLRALSKNPVHRFQTAAEFELNLAHVAEHLDEHQAWLRTTTFDASEAAASAARASHAPTAVGGSPSSGPWGALASSPQGNGSVRAAVFVAITVAAALAGVGLVRAVRLLLQ